MAIRTEELQLRVLIDGSPARRELTTLDQEYAKLNSQQKLLKKGTDEYVANHKRMDEVRQRQAALRQEIGLTALTEKQLTQELQRLLAEGRNLTRYTEQWVKNREAVAAVRRELKATADASKLPGQALTAQQRAIQGMSGQVGMLGGAWNSAKGALLGYVGVGAAIFGTIRVLADAARIFQDFEKGQSRLQAITRASTEDMKRLSDQAKQLGATTAFTASQVLELQTELAKLGFTTREIEAATEGILQLAAAADTDLANAASITAQTLNAFGLEAGDTQRLVDVMARSFTTSALDIEKFSASMSNAAPAAKAMGISVEETTASLGKLVDNGIVAEKAGTDLRMIYIQLATQGITWNQAQEKILNSQNKLATAVELFDVRAAGSALILAEQADAVADLTTELEGATGAAADMAQAQLDNLRGDQLILTSAWEGFVLSVEDGSGVISKATRDITQGFTNILNVLTEVNDVTTSWREKVAALISVNFGRQGAAFRALAGALWSGRDAAAAQEQTLAQMRDRLQEVTTWQAEYAKNGKEQLAAQYAQEAAALRLKIAAAENQQQQEEQAASEAAAAETVAAARARLTEALEKEKGLRDAMARTDREGLALADQRIAAIQKELDALDGKKDKDSTGGERARKREQQQAQRIMEQMERDLVEHRERMLQANLTADDQEVRRLQVRHAQEYADLLANELATAEDLAALREVQAQEMADAIAEQGQRRMALRQEESEQVLQALLTEQEAALAAEEQKWQQLIDLARTLGPEYAAEVAQLEERMGAALQAIRDKYRTEEEQKRIEDRRKALAEKIEVYQAIGSGLAGANQLMAAAFAASGKANYEQTVAAKTLGIAQIAISQGVAIARAIEGAQTLPPPLNFAAAASGVASVLAGIAQAIALVNGAQVSAPAGIGVPSSAPGTPTGVPLGEKGGIFEGPSHAQGGLKVYDPRRRRVVAEVEGGEPWMVLSRAFRQKNPGLVPRLLQASAQGTKLGQRGGIFAPMPAFNFRSATEAIHLAQGGIVGNSQYTFKKGSGISDGSGLGELLALQKAMLDEMRATRAATQAFPTRIQAVASITDFNRRSTEYAQLQQRNKVRRA